jgi:hypothetical protein
MSKIEKVRKPTITASPRPCAVVSADRGNAPQIAPERTPAVLPTRDSDAPVELDAVTR